MRPRRRGWSRSRGYAVTFAEYAGGHDYLVWRGALADALLDMWK
jgi:enterochelin esterase family protein